MMKAGKCLMPVLAGLLLAICLECFHAISAAGSGYQEGDRKLSLSSVQINGYATEGDLYFPTDTSPWMSFRAEQGIGSLELYFSEPLQSDLDAELYYAVKETDGFDRFQAVNSYMMKGTEIARFQLPAGDFRNIRLDIRGGPFYLEKIEAWSAVPLSELTAGRIASGLHPFRLLATAVVIVAGLSAEAGRRRRARSKSWQERVIWMDAVRVTAAIFVIAAHVLEPVQPMIPQGIVSRTADGVLLLLLSCNLLFFLLSGALLLPYREESIKNFMVNRFVKVVLPFLICSFLYIKLSCASLAAPGLWFSYTIRSLFTGDVRMGPHLWLIYELFGAYLAAVPLRYMLRDMPEKTEKQMVCLILVLLSIRTASAALGEAPGFTVFLDGWIGIFLMGYFMTRDWMRKYDRLWLICGVLALAASLGIAEIRADYKNIVCNQSIFMLCIACALFVSALHLERYLQPLRNILAYLSGYSYLVLLVHYFVLHQVIYNGWFHSSLPAAAQVILPITACGVVSLLMAAAIAHTVLAAAEAALWPVKRLVSRRKR